MQILHMESEQLYTYLYPNTGIYAVSNLPLSLQQQIGFHSRNFSVDFRGDKPIIVTPKRKIKGYRATEIVDAINKMSSVRHAPTPKKEPQKVTNEKTRFAKKLEQQKKLQKNLRKKKVVQYI